MRFLIERAMRLPGFNWATSQQKWIVVTRHRPLSSILVSIGPLLSRNGQISWISFDMIFPACFNWATSQQKWIVVTVFENDEMLEQFQLGHFLAEMDRAICILDLNSRLSFQLGHFLAEMDRSKRQLLLLPLLCFNWATSQQKWIEQTAYENTTSKQVSIGPLLSRNGQPTRLPAAVAMDASFNWATSQQKWIAQALKQIKEADKSFQLGHFLAEMDRGHSVANTSQVYTFQLGHFLAEMDRVRSSTGTTRLPTCFNWATSQQKWIDHEIVPRTYTWWGFNWATSQQKWIEHATILVTGIMRPVSIGPLLSRNGQCDTIHAFERTGMVSIGPLLSRNGQKPFQNLVNASR